jgi:raffinose/stachyose/melibiose transport system permease protein
VRLIRRYWLDAIALAVMLVVFVVPFGFIALTAVKDRAESARLDFSWPSSWHLWENVVEVVTTRDRLLVTAMRNSFVVTVVSVALLVIVCAMAGFVLERRRDRMATVVSAGVLAGLIIPPAVVPTIYVLQEINLFNSLWGLVLVEVAYLAPFSVILFRAFVARRSPGSWTRRR